MSSSIDDFQQKHVSYSTLTSTELPYHCPPKDTQKWNMHPKVFLKFDIQGRASCPYCGSNYKIV